MTTTINPHDVAVADIPKVRADLLAEGDALVTRAAGAALDPAAESDFHAITRNVAVLDFRARAAELGDAAGRVGARGIIPDKTVTGDGDAPERPPREVGGISPIAFSEEQVRGLHESLMRNQPGQATALETRAVTAPPMATISDFRLPPVTKLRERFRIASLLPMQATAHVSATFYTTSTGATAAATVAEGALKPTSNPAYTAVTVPVRKIAHIVDVSKEALDDYPSMNQIVQEEMTAGLINTENLQLLSGDGTGTNLTGMLTASGILTYTPGAAEARYVSIRHAIRLLQAAFIDPDTVILNPADAEIFDLSNSTGAGLHAVLDNDSPGASVGALGSAPSRWAWGLRIVSDTMQTAGTATVASFAQAAVVFQREPANIFVDPFSQSANNLVRFICEERLALGVLRPTAICLVTFNGTV